MRGRGISRREKKGTRLTRNAQPVQTPSTTRSPRRRLPTSTRTTSRTRTSSLLVRYYIYTPPLRHEEYRNSERGWLTVYAEKKQREELAKTVGKGKGPLNTGSQGIKKSGKK
jgi:hypothetical protein